MSCLLVGMVGSALAFGGLLGKFSEIRLIQVIQGAALATMVLNVIALWKQEPRRPSLTAPDRERPAFRDSWRALRDKGLSVRSLIAVGLGTAGFSMQDILLEPYGGEILQLSVGQTTTLTAFMAAGTLVGLAFASRWLARDFDPYRLAGGGAVLGIFAFSAVIFAAPLESLPLFFVGTTLIGFGGGLFAVGTLTAVMDLASSGHGRPDPGRLGRRAGVGGGNRRSPWAARSATSSPVSRPAARSAARSPDRQSATASSTTSKSLCCSSRWSPSGPLVRRTQRARQRSGSPRFGLAELPG